MLHPFADELVVHGEVYGPYRVLAVLRELRRITGDATGTCSTRLDSPVF